MRAEPTRRAARRSFGATPSIAALTLVALASAARAQSTDGSGVYVDDPAVEPDQEADVPTLRTAPRLALGFDAGLGTFSCARCNDDRFTGLAALLFAGVLATDRVAVLAESWGVFTFRPDGSRNDGLLFVDHTTLDARVWLAPTLWLDAGGGAALLVRRASAAGRLTELAPAATLAVGGELDHRPHRGINLQVRAAYAAFDADVAGRLWTIATVVGLHFY